ALLAGRAPGLTAALRSSDARYVLLDGTLAECDRVGDSRADYSGKHRRHGVNLQVITTPDGTLVWISPALAGRTHDLTAAPRHRIIATCIRLGIPVLADKAYQGAGGTVAVPHRRNPGKDLTAKQSSVNRAHSRLRWPVERAIARIKTWRILRKARLSPNTLTSIAKAILTLETHH
ncbi:transposase family protein, partial [Streptomyces lavendulae]|uniref:HARBI1 family protein n=1 Tax=Streptomyces lavendulae TaxID=1914 RepID=UPI00340D977A